MRKIIYIRKWLSVTFLLLFFMTNLNCHASAKKPELFIVADKLPGDAVVYGMNTLTDALKAKNISYEKVGSIDEAWGEIVIVTGLAYGEGTAAQILKAENQEVPKVAEALKIWRTNRQGKKVLIVSGFDDTGLMYALLDVADRIGRASHSQSPLSEVKEANERPYVSERAVSLYTMNRAYWESRFYDEAYWEKYLDLLAKNRFNSLVVIFGYENGGFLAPCYPYFFNVEGFPDVRMVGLTPDEQQKNLKAFNNLIEMAHKRGIKLKAGIWDHIYRGGVQSGGIPGTEHSGQPIENQVWGINAENLMPYTKQALVKFIKLVPDLDGIQFRMHGESGLKEGEQENFWADVFKFLKKTAPQMEFDLRAKGMPESVIQIGLDAGINFRIATKYWMEQMGMPYHPTHINRENQFDRRHGYADMLIYPKQYKLHWRLWNGGTTRILLWGNPEYVKRFAKSTHLYDGEGFEVNEPLATKMHGQPHDAKPFELIKPEYRYYDYEFERYWQFFQMFGRLSYNPDTPPDVWEKEFEQRFGEKAGPLVEAALHQASWILPRIVASVYHYDSSFPTTRGWAEKQRLGDLPLYSLGEGSDIQQFASFDEEAQMLIEGGETPKILPSMSSLWFKQTATDVLNLVAEAEAATGSNRNNEFNSTVTDLKILSNLAIYHSRRIPAAVYYRLFQRTQNVSALDSAIAYERSAIEAWRKIIVAAGDVYANDLMMGVRNIKRSNDVLDWTKSLSGHWKDELILLEKGVSSLEQEKKDYKAQGNVQRIPHYKAAARASNNGLFQITHQAVDSAWVSHPIKVDVKINAKNGVKWVRLRYRGVNQELDYQTLQMLPDDAGNYQVSVPASQIDPKWDFMYFIEVMDKAGNGTIYPDLDKETPYRIVKLIR